MNIAMLSRAIVVVLPCLRSRGHVANRLPRFLDREFDHHIET
jgi:hypothetical protein